MLELKIVYQMAFLNWRPAGLFYGWWVVAASFFIALYVGGIIFYGFTAFFEPIANELGWSYTQISLAASLRGLKMSLLAPFMGILVHPNEMDENYPARHARIAYLCHEILFHSKY